MKPRNISYCWTQALSSTEAVLVNYVHLPGILVIQILKRVWEDNPTRFLENLQVVFPWNFVTIQTWQQDNIGPNRRQQHSHTIYYLSYILWVSTDHQQECKGTSQVRDKQKNSQAETRNINIKLVFVLLRRWGDERRGRERWWRSFYSLLNHRERALELELSTLKEHGCSAQTFVVEIGTTRLNIILSTWYKCMHSICIKLRVHSVNNIFANSFLDSISCWRI